MFIISFDLHNDGKNEYDCSYFTEEETEAWKVNL